MSPFGKNVPGYTSPSRSKPCTNVWRTIPESRLYRSYPPRLAADIWSPSGESELPSLVDRDDVNQCVIGSLSEQTRTWEMAC